MAKDEITNVLRQMVEPRLLGRKWPVSAEEVPRVIERFIELALLTAEGEDAWRYTELCCALNETHWRLFVGSYAQGRATMPQP